ncbi:oligopeptide transporter [Xylaria grammica]|nr:oligopeptide transporter [Xylaria grammica]
MGLETHSDLPRDATQEEIDSLVHEIADIPLTAWVLSFTGAAAQFARFGITITWQNYLQNPRGSSPSPGALGLGESRASIIQNAYLFFQYLTPLPFAVLSDMYIGRYKTMVISLSFLILGYVVLFATSLPSALDRGAGLGGLIVAMLLTGVGQGALSAILYPFIDQIPVNRSRVQQSRNGTLVVTDRQLAVQYIFNGYYWMVNIAALSSIPTTLLEKHVGFWAAYLLPTVVLIVACVPALIWRKRFARFHLSAANPEYQLQHDNRVVPWDSAFVEEVRRGLKGCRVIICFVIFWLCYNQTTNNIISQSGQAEQHGLSNDTFQALNPIACIIIGPLLQNLLFPFLRSRRISFGPIMRMTVAFLFIAGGLAYAAGFQQLIYSRGPCYSYPLEPNEVNVWIQTPLHFLLAAGEILGIVSLNEYIQHEAPVSTKAMVRALQEIAAAVASALGIGLGPVSKNPYLTILFASLAGTMALSAVLFWIAFRKDDLDYRITTVEVEEGVKPAECDASTKVE